MKISEIRVKNLRLYGDEEQTITIDIEKNIAILLGDNGAGKTSLLYGCSVLLSQFFEPFPKVSTKNFTDSDVHIVSATRRADYMHVGLNIDTNSESVITVDQYVKGNSQDIPVSSFKEIREYAANIKSCIDNDKPVTLPVLAYYGTERGQISAPERRRDFNVVFPRWASYESALDSATNFKRFFTWFERNEDEERREKEKRKDFGYSSFVLDVVRKALNRIETHLINPRVEASPLRFVMDDVCDPENPKEVRIESMSDGYRIMIALVADIAARMAEANPSIECSELQDILDTPGIIFIDEIDLHLHPIWQRKVLSQLSLIFPKVQFIVTTHSPSVVLGALDIAQVIKLDKGSIDDKICLEQYQKYDISLMLLSQLFGLDNVRSDRYAKLTKEIHELLVKRNLNPEEHKRLIELQTLLYQYGDMLNTCVNEENK